MSKIELGTHSVPTGLFFLGETTSCISSSVTCIVSFVFISPFMILGIFSEKLFFWADIWCLDQVVEVEVDFLADLRYYCVVWYSIIEIIL